ncbi:hypothetical protein PPERSA_04923 [Pseudocohnilembus persalinus]|uniref:Golgi apparatus membrane protein TVP23 homolog n=1 Tax=Pseudocohnilembus persalinus TaxID=266149 RepID=A0A0V0R8E2_PSEPJ|nr:hypothetical protein PPERSA_04923 [Pseudocohnilembus persalinus]|eukprot:KRX10756.1 hypothetical protein PPERSA_04923 [Pseudocohnilembus persalinus]
MLKNDQYTQYQQMNQRPNHPQQPYNYLQIQQQQHQLSPQQYGHNVDIGNHDFTSRNRYTQDNQQFQNTNNQNNYQLQSNISPFTSANNFYTSGKHQTIQTRTSNNFTNKKQMSERQNYQAKQNFIQNQELDLKQIQNNNYCSNFDQQQQEITNQNEKTKQIPNNQIAKNEMILKNLSLDENDEESTILQMYGQLSGHQNQNENFQNKNNLYRKNQLNQINDGLTNRSINSNQILDKPLNDYGFTEQNEYKQNNGYKNSINIANQKLEAKNQQQQINQKNNRDQNNIEQHGQNLLFKYKTPEMSHNNSFNNKLQQNKNIQKQNNKLNTYNYEKKQENLEDTDEIKKQYRDKNGQKAIQNGNFLTQNDYYISKLSKKNSSNKYQSNSRTRTYQQLEEQKKSENFKKLIEDNEKEYLKNQKSIQKKNKDVDSNQNFNSQIIQELQIQDRYGTNQEQEDYQPGDFSESQNQEQEININKIYQKDYQNQSEKSMNKDEINSRNNNFNQKQQGSFQQQQREQQENFKKIRQNQDQSQNQNQQNQQNQIQNDKTLAELFMQKKKNLASKMEKQKQLNGTKKSQERKKNQAQKPPLSNQEKLDKRKEMIEYGKKIKNNNNNNNNNINNNCQNIQNNSQYNFNSDGKGVGKRPDRIKNSNVSQGSGKQPPVELLQRLALGGKTKVSEKEAKERSKKNYQKLPEQLRKKEEEQKNQEKLNQLRLRKEKIKMMDEVFEIVIILNAFDFWTVKNITGRLLVGLRWWSETMENGEDNWVFECHIKEKTETTINDTVFWGAQTIFVLIWGLFLVINILSIDISTGCTVLFAMQQTGINLYYYYKCSRVQKQRIKKFATEIGTDIAYKLMNQTIKLPINFY